MAYVTMLFQFITNVNEKYG